MWDPMLKNCEIQLIQENVQWLFSHNAFGERQWTVFQHLWSTKMQFINVPTSKSQCFSCICTRQVSETTQLWTDAADSVTWLTLIRGNTCCLQCPASLLESNEATLSIWQTPNRRSSTGTCPLVGDDLSIRVRQVEPFRWDGGEKKSGFYRNEEPGGGCDHNLWSVIVCREDRFSMEAVISFLACTSKNWIFSLCCRVYRPTEELIGLA